MHPVSLPTVWAPPGLALVLGVHGCQATLRKDLGSEGTPFPSQRDREAGRAARARGRGEQEGGVCRGKAQSELGQRLLGFIYLGGRRRGSLAVGGLRAEASSFGGGGGRGWVLGGRRGADYDRGGHGEVGAVCGEGLLAPLLKRAARTGSEGHPTAPAASPPQDPGLPNVPEQGVVGTGRRGTERPGAEAGAARSPGSGHQGACCPSKFVSLRSRQSSSSTSPAASRPICLSAHLSVCVLPGLFDPHPLQQESSQPVRQSVPLLVFPPPGPRGDSPHHREQGVPL